MSQETVIYVLSSVTITIYLEMKSYDFIAAPK